MTNAMTREKVVAFLVVRLTSSRFPAKHLRKIGPRRIIDWSLAGLRQSRQIDQIVIATVAEAENEPLRQVAAEQGVDLFWYEGEVDHVTTRLRKAAESFGADICLLISGDCPLIYAPLIDLMVEELKAHPEADYVKVLPDAKGQPPLLEGQGVFRCRAWQRADDLSDRPELKEHQFPIIGLRPDQFVAYDQIRLKPQFYGQQHRYSIDTWSDLVFMNQVYQLLADKQEPFDLPAVIKLIEENPQLREINAHVHQRRLVEDVKRAVFIVDAGSGFGYGHLIRCIELAHQLVERKSYPVIFIVDDERASSLLADQGISYLWGAYGREARQAPAGQNEMFFDSSLYDFAVLDIYAGRTLEAGWRERDFPETKVLVLDNLALWTSEADQVVIPGVTVPENPERRYSAGPSPELYYGKEYIILRRDVRSAKPKSAVKDWDLVVYLHDPELRRDVRSFAANSDLKIFVIENFDETFPALLASAHAYLGNFGYSFYEAAFLNCYPFNWPLSDRHAEDSRLFYQRMGLPDGVVGSLSDFLTKWEHYRSHQPENDLSFGDGTPRIIEILAQANSDEKEAH